MSECYHPPTTPHPNFPHQINDPKTEICDASTGPKLPHPPDSNPAIAQKKVKTQSHGQ